MATSQHTRFTAALRRIPRGWTFLGAFLLSGILWMLILWGVTLIAQAADCPSDRVTEAQLPPPEYRHEPSMPYSDMPARFLNAMVGEKARGGGQVYGFYSEHSGKIWVCEGLTGDALRIIRMHEEAHAMGWRHAAE